jgi:lipopolysaccharide biosynthesis regulator YciM
MVAQRANAASKADDALTYLQSNLEYNPKSSRSYLMMSLIHNGKGDKASAIKDLEKAIELDPNNAQAKAQLQQLKGQ